MKLNEFRQDLQDYQDYLIDLVRQNPVYPVDPVKKKYQYHIVSSSIRMTLLCQRRCSYKTTSD